MSILNDLIQDIVVPAYEFRYALHYGYQLLKFLLKK